MRTSIALLTRFTAFGGLILALTLAPSLFGSGDIAEAKTKQQCYAKAQSCELRCSARAGEKYGVYGSSTSNQAKAGAEYNNCNNRTCSPQLKTCLANASDAKEQPLKQQKATRSPTTAPTQPLRPQKATRSPATAPTQPLRPQNATRSPATAPQQPITSSPSFRRGDR